MCKKTQGASSRAIVFCIFLPLDLTVLSSAALASIFCLAEMLSSFKSSYFHQAYYNFTNPDVLCCASFGHLSGALHFVFKTLHLSKRACMNHPSIWVMFESCRVLFLILANPFCTYCKRQVRISPFCAKSIYLHVECFLCWFVALNIRDEVDIFIRCSFSGMCTVTSYSERYWRTFTPALCPRAHCTDSSHDRHGTET